jgi:hypothetical protein
LSLKPISPLVQMAALHLHEAARGRDRSSPCQEQDGPRPFGHPSGNAWSPQEGIEFFPLSGGYRHNPLVPWHWNILVHENLIFASLVSGS